MWVYPRVGGGTPGPQVLGFSLRRSIPAWAGEPGRSSWAGAIHAVYPRVGGGTGVAWPSTTYCAGLSPRGRGNRIRPVSKRCLERSIPAWAGEPLFAARAARRAAVYPRVGGGTGEIVVGQLRCIGLSPRGRGNRFFSAFGNGLIGSIPAWAGEPSDRASCGISPGVYPRVGGGTSGIAGAEPKYWGLSPRGRGNRPQTGEKLLYVRSIPAWAGEPRPLSLARPIVRVYPRVGGGTGARGLGRSTRGGLSPRGRGNP